MRRFVPLLSQKKISSQASINRFSSPSLVLLHQLLDFNRHCLSMFTIVTKDFVISGFCMRTGHQAGFQGATYIDCPKKLYHSPRSSA
ncbi:hypothetical protein L1987_65144 [Smallanthus sonchifolius]|uniref:Uncharacterized protein n=1 Tax=Smallanthus sonchifolius TaxID=185202 RepID=A0ACB9BTI4_9ASTR|nr:hypothetical protein L1987_65144 [Smallanthus sonchifolius]